MTLDKSGPLTPSDVLALAAVVGAAQRNATVARFFPDTGEITFGTARHLSHKRNGGYLSLATDVRDAWLRVTTRQGFEIWWQVATLAREAASGDFVIDPMSTPQ
jgi:hypothetical protein